MNIVPTTTAPVVRDRDTACTAPLLMVTPLIVSEVAAVICPFSMLNPFMVSEVAALITPPEEMVSELPILIEPVVRDRDTAETAPPFTVIPLRVLEVAATKDPAAVTAPSLVTVKPVLIYW